MWHSNNCDLSPNDQKKWLYAALQLMKETRVPPELKNTSEQFDLYVKCCINETFYTLCIALENFDLAEEIHQYASSQVTGSTFLNRMRYLLDAMAWTESEVELPETVQYWVPTHFRYPAMKSASAEPVNVDVELEFVVTENTDVLKCDIDIAQRVEAYEEATTKELVCSQLSDRFVQRETSKNICAEGRSWVLAEAPPGTYVVDASSTLTGAVGVVRNTAVETYWQKHADERGNDEVREPPQRRILNTNLEVGKCYREYIDTTFLIAQSVELLRLISVPQ